MLFDFALRQTKVRDEFAEFVFEPADHDLIEEPWVGDLFTTNEALRVEHRQQRREAVRVSVVRSGRKEKAVFEEGGEFAHAPSELRVDGVGGRGGRGGMVRSEERRVGKEGRSRWS